MNPVDISVIFTAVSTMVFVVFRLGQLVARVSELEVRHKELVDEVHELRGWLHAERR